MTDDQNNQSKNETQPGEIGRRDFMGLSVAAGLAATAESAAAAGTDVVETDVEIKTPDGTCDAAFIHPKSGTHPGVLIWPDAFGLRPWTREMGKRLAAEGYSVLVPNPFYRISKAPFTDASTFNFQNPADRAKLSPLMASVNADWRGGEGCRRLHRLPGCAEGSEQVEEDRDAGLLHGRAADNEDGRGSAESRGRRCVVPRRRFGDRQTRQPASARAEDQGPYVYRYRVQRRHAAAGRQGQAPGSIRGGESSRRDRSVSGNLARLVRAGHAQAGNGKPIYNQADAERAWGKLLALYKAAIA